MGHSGGMDLHTLIDTVPTGLFIDGEFCPAASGATFEVINPSDGSVLTEVADAGDSDVTKALDSIVAAQDSWAATPPRERGEILRRAWEILMERKEELALLMSAELGRAFKDSLGEVTYGAEFFRWFAEEAVRMHGDYRIGPDGTSRIVEVQQPVGPCLAITPWNFPLAMGTRKAGAALAAGCTMLVKPASKTPLTMLYLASALREAGLPQGVFAVMPTSQSSLVSNLIDDPRLRKFTFTGSTEVGEQLAAKAAASSKRISMELGGNAPFVVLEDADMNTVMESVAVAKMRGAGQVCIAANRFLVHHSRYQEFVERVSEYISGLRIGVGTDAEVDYGPLSGEDQVEKVSALVDDALERGATRHTSAALPDGLPSGGFYYPATVLGNVPQDAEITRTEIFGPVVAVTSCESDEAAICAANDTPFGLAAYVFSENLNTALSAAERIEAGMVAVNKGALSDPSAPFGGVKESGMGREGSRDGIREFLETKFISLPR